MAMRIRTNEAGPDYSKVNAELEVRGDKVGGLDPDSVIKLIKAKTPLFLISTPKDGPAAMLPVISTKTKDAWVIKDGTTGTLYDPHDYDDGEILVVRDAVKPFPVNWLTLDDCDRVYFNVSDLEPVLKTLGYIG